MILLSYLFPIKLDCFVFVLTVGAPNQAIKNSLSLNHYLTLINQNTWQNMWISTKPIQDKPALLLFSLEKAADALSLSLSSMLALWKPQFREVRPCRGSQSPACSQFRFSSSCLPRCYKSSSHLLLLIHSLSSPPLTQNLAKTQEHSSSSESPPHCGQAEHWLGVNREEGAWCFQVPLLPFLRLRGWLSLQKQDIRNIPIYELWSQNELLGFSLPRCG